MLLHRAGELHELTNIGLQVASFGQSAIGSNIKIVLNGTGPLPPVAHNDSATTAQDTAVTIDVLANDSPDSLTVTNLTQPANGAATLNLDNTVTYTPIADFVGTDTFTYTANNGVLDSNVADVTITVNRANTAPVATNDSATTNEDNAVTIDVLANDSDADEADTLTVANLTQPANGAVTLNADDTVTYTPAANWSGTDQFTYQANDGIDLSNVATVTITVNAVNDPPVASFTYATNGLTVDFDAGGPQGCYDPDGTIVSYAWVFGDGSTGSGVTVSHTYAAAGTYTVTLTVTDNDGAVNSNVATATITVVEPALPDVSGTIIAPDGSSPLGGIQVKLYIQTVTRKGTSWKTVASTTTDAQGWYAFDGLQDGESYQVEPRSKTYDFDVAQFTFTAGESVVINFTAAESSGKSPRGKKQSDF